MKTVQIRRARASDFERIWPIFQAVVSEGETYAYDPATTFEEAEVLWMSGRASEVYVAESGEAIIGTYVLKPNQPGLGSHVANASYMVAPHARGHRIGRALAEHSIGRAAARGYRSMVFNLVVSTNDRAMALWLSLGFRIVGTLSGAFRHRTLGFVDAHIMELMLHGDSP